MMTVVCVVLCALLACVNDSQFGPFRVSSAKNAMDLGSLQCNYIAVCKFGLAEI